MARTQSAPTRLRFIAGSIMLSPIHLFKSPGSPDCVSLCGGQGADAAAR
jgi:hypothetical protein